MSEEKNIKDVEIIISKILRVGVVLGGSIILIGVLIMLITGTTGYEAGYFPVNINAIFSGVILLKSSAIILLGLLILILTPVIRVVSSIFIFLHEGDYLYVKITLVVLAILILSFFIGEK